MQFTCDLFIQVISTSSLAAPFVCDVPVGKCEQLWTWFILVAHTAEDIIITWDQYRQMELSDDITLSEFALANTRLGYCATNSSRG